MKIVLVTGSNRSGTTWLGKMLSLSEKFLEMYEPFNHLIHAPMIGFSSPFKEQYHYVLERESEEIKRYLNFKIIGSIFTSISTYTETDENHQPSKITKAYRAIDNLGGLLMNTKQILIKDPIALLSADWIAREYSAQVIILIRHPAAYVSSIKRLNWDMSLDTFTCQKEFLATLPEDLASAIAMQVINRPPCNGYNLEDAALSWKVFHYVIHCYKQLYPEWIFIRHEDLCSDFIQGFHQLYSNLSLPFTEKIKNIMQQYCHRQDIPNLGSNVHVLKRDSSSIPALWKKNLNQDEVDRIRDITKDIANFFYEDTSWE